MDRVVELWGKIRNHLDDYISGHLASDVIEACTRERKWCQDDVGIYVYQRYEKPSGSYDELYLFSVTCFDYRLMGIRPMCSTGGDTFKEYYYLNGPKMIEYVVQELVDQLEVPLTYDEVVDIFLKLVERYPVWVTEAIAHIAFRWWWHQKNEDYDRAFEADEYIADILFDAKEIFPDKAKDIEEYYKKVRIKGDIWRAIKDEVRKKLRYGKYEIVTHLSPVSPHTYKKVGIEVYTLIDRVPKYGTYILSFRHHGITYRLFIIYDTFIDAAIDSVIKYAEKNGIKLDRSRAIEELYNLAKNKPEQTAETVISAVSRQINETLRFEMKTELPVNTELLDEFIKLVQQATPQDATKTTQMSS